MIQTTLKSTKAILLQIRYVYNKCDIGLVVDKVTKVYYSCAFIFASEKNQNLGTAGYIQCGSARSVCFQVMIFYGMHCVNYVHFQ